MKLPILAIVFLLVFFLGCLAPQESKLETLAKNSPPEARILIYVDTWKIATNPSITQQSSFGFIPLSIFFRTVKVISLGKDETSISLEPDETIFSLDVLGFDILASIAPFFINMMKPEGITIQDTSYLGTTIHDIVGMDFAYFTDWGRINIGKTSNLKKLVDVKKTRASSYPKFSNLIPKVPDGDILIVTRIQGQNISSIGASVILKGNMSDTTLVLETNNPSLFLSQIKLLEEEGGMHILSSREEQGFLIVRMEVETERIQSLLTVCC